MHVMKERDFTHRFRVLVQHQLLLDQRRQLIHNACRIEHGLRREFVLVKRKDLDFVRLFHPDVVKQRDYCAGNEEEKEVRSVTDGRMNAGATM